jgi:Lar family restriction alleviation protein
MKNKSKTGDSSTPLLSCPFCGEAPWVHTEKLFGDDVFDVRCNCGAQTGNGWAKTSKEASTRWNKRSI